MAAPPDALGFPNCRHCPYVHAGNGAACLACVEATHPPKPNPCPTCQRQLEPNGSCWNFVCGWSDLHLGTVHALTHRGGDVYSRLVALKEGRASGWQIIFGRLITAWLMDWFRYHDYELVLVNPTHASRDPRHMEMILDAAIAEDPVGHIAYDDPADPTLEKVTTTTRSRSGKWREKYEAAKELRYAVRIRHPERLVDARVLLIDDVTTTLLQLEILAEMLMDAGAHSVDGLVLCRA